METHDNTHFNKLVSVTLTYLFVLFLQRGNYLTLNSCIYCFLTYKPDYSFQFTN